MCECLSLCMCTMCVGTHGDQKRVLDTQELALQTIVSCYVGPGHLTRFSEGADSALNH